MPRSIYDVTPDVQMAIRLRAVKAGITTGEVVAEAVNQAFPDDVDEAIEVIAQEASNNKQH